MSRYEFRSPDLAGHDIYDSLEEVRDALRRSRWAPVVPDIEARIERREVGEWSSLGVGDV